MAVTMAPVSGNADKIVVLLHGSHANGTEMEWIANEWRKDHPSAVFVIPKAHQLATGTTDRVIWYLPGDPDRDPEGLLQAATAVNALVDEACSEYGLPSERVVLAGYSQGMTVAFEASRLRVSPVGAVIGFSGVLPPKMEVIAAEARPAALLVHGEVDTAVPFYEMTSSEGRLRHLRFSTLAVPVPGVGHWIDHFGAYQAGRFMRDTLDVAAVQNVSWDEFKKKAKLLIWDLDDTFWAGTLAENDEVQLHQHRADIVRQLNRHGLVSSICSKNDYAKAKEKLVEFDVWDDFVFPRIDFRPKGAVIKTLLEEMQLRAANTIFLDDNTHNLEEVRAVCPGVWCLDARDADFDDKLAELVEAHEHVHKSRVDTYRSLQSKADDRETAEGSPDEFLRACNIHIAVAWRADVFDYSKRIEELINRTNQMNFTKSRVAEGAMDIFLAEPMLRESFAVFVWDKYGYHGLVGFVGVDIPNQRLLHMAFSCRIMHMGVEEWVLDKVMQRFPDLHLPKDFPVKRARPDWIHEQQYTDAGIRQFIFNNEKKALSVPAKTNVRIMANCQSGALAHFSGLRDEAEIDNFPRIFNVFHMLDGRWKEQNFPNYLVYGIYTDYFDDMWPEGMRAHINNGLYEEASEAFVNLAKSKSARILAIPTPTGIPEHMYHPDNGITAERAAIFTDVWRRLAARYDNVELLPIETLCRGDQMLDDTHFSIDVTRTLSTSIRDWVTRARSDGTAAA